MENLQCLKNAVNTYVAQIHEINFLEYYHTCVTSMVLRQDID